MLVMKPLIVFKNSIKGWQITKFSVSFLTCGLSLQVPRAVLKRINKQRSGEKDNLHGLLQTQTGRRKLFRGGLSVRYYCDGSRPGMI